MKTNFLILSIISILIASSHFSYSFSSEKTTTYTHIAQHTPQELPNTYVGLSAGYGNVPNHINLTQGIRQHLPELFPIPNISQGFAILSQNNESKNNDFAGRWFAGYFFNVTHSIFTGPEIGLSLYPSITHTDHSLLDLPQFPAGRQIMLTDSINVRSGGVDVLLNILWKITKSLEFNIRPGTQFAIEKTKINLNTTVVSNSAPVLHRIASYSTTKLLPEIMVGFSWNVFLPLYIDLSYQKVFGSAKNDFFFTQDPPVNSREMLALGLQYRFRL